MVEIALFSKFLIALALGALMGLERERFARERDHYLFGGIRTFMFISLLGAVSTYVSIIFWSWFVVPVFASVLFLVAMSYYAGIQWSKGESIGMTGELVALLAFIFGVMTMGPEPIYAVVLTILVTAFLYSKKKLHEFVRALNHEEMRGTLIFAILTFVILPFLPNNSFGPLDVLNPFKIWLMVVFISGLGYIGYVLIKILGSKKGVGLTGLLGGLVSSTAVTMTMAGHSKKEKNDQLAKLFVFATLIANAVMFVRVILEVAVVNKELLPDILIPMSVMGFVTLVSSLVLWLEKGHKKVETHHNDVVHTSPLALKPALKFGLLFAVILIVVKAAQIYFGNAGIYVASIISGFVDVDAITLSMASLARTEVSSTAAVTAITLAVMSNTIIKFGFAALLGSKKFRDELGVVFGLVIFSGILAIFFL